MTTKTVLITSGATWTPPSDAVGTNAKVVCFGSGGNGGNGAPFACFPPPYGGGGGSGAIAVKNSFFISTGSAISIQIPTHGSGSDCWFNTTGTVRAGSGSNGVSNSATPGSGGSFIAGDTGRNGNGGGNGGAGCTVNGGGGGGTPSEGAAGTAGSGQTHGNSGSVSGNGQAGNEYTITAGGTAGAGAGGNGATASCSGDRQGDPAGNYGGGGGGGAGSLGGATGGIGGDGAIIVIYTVISVTSVTQNKGTTAGGQSVTIAGTGFTGASSVTFGGVSATSIVVNSDISITCTTPAHAAGAVDVVVTATAGVGTGTGAYTFITIDVTDVTPNSGTTAGGQSVTLTGHGFTGGTSATLGGVAITSFSVVNDNSITGVTGAHAAGLVSAVVNTPFGTGTGSNLYTYVTPTIPAPQTFSFPTTSISSVVRTLGT